MEIEKEQLHNTLKVIFPSDISILCCSYIGPRFLDVDISKVKTPKYTQLVQEMDNLFLKEEDVKNASLFFHQFLKENIFNEPGVYYTSFSEHAEFCEVLSCVLLKGFLRYGKLFINHVVRPVQAVFEDPSCRISFPLVSIFGDILDKCGPLLTQHSHKE